MSVHVLEAGEDIGGTWYWNRYPGCRFDSESYSYCYSFSPELLQEWNWTEHFAPQAETLRYLNFVVDKLDLRRSIEFKARVKCATYDSRDNVWIVETEDGRVRKGRFLITAIGILSAPVIPEIPGRENFHGPSFHTADWPKTPLDLNGLRVAVIGTGASGVQVIQEIGKIVGHLTVFQRGGNWCAPLKNSPIEKNEMERIKASYPDIFARCRDTPAAFLHGWDERSALDVSDEERDQFYQKLYDEPGLGIWVGNFHDIFTNERAAATAGDFMAKKIRQRVKNPQVAELLIPKDHLFGTKRVPLETDYYETYNRENVELVDLKSTPIECITRSGIVYGGKERPFDVIIFATGFDAVRGAFDRIEFNGVGGRSLYEKWLDGPQTYMGLQIHGFPNLMTLVGPHNGATFCNIPRCIEQNVEFVTAMLQYMRKHGYDRVEAAESAEQSWTARVYEVAAPLVLNKVDSWLTSANARLPGERKRRLLLYAGGQQDFREYCANVVSNDYEGFEMTTLGGVL
jgi:cation diffusion facilitator CzcD-associated flavoprotein CzcO